MTTDEPDQFDPLQSRGAVGILRGFNRAGILATSDVHVALRLSELSDSTDEVVQLGVAFAARAPRLASSKRRSRCSRRFSGGCSTSSSIACRFTLPRTASSAVEAS